MNELYHYGTLGMRWHHRKYSNDKGRLNARGKSRYKPNNAFRKAGARFEAPGVKLGNVTTMYKRKHKSRKKVSTKKIHGGRTAVEKALSSYAHLTPSDEKFKMAVEEGRYYCYGG